MRGVEEERIWSWDGFGGRLIGVWRIPLQFLHSDGQKGLVGNAITQAHHINTTTEQEWRIHMQSLFLQCLISMQSSPFTPAII